VQQKKNNEPKPMFNQFAPVGIRHHNKITTMKEATGEK